MREAGVMKRAFGVGLVAVVLLRGVALGAGGGKERKAILDEQSIEPVVGEYEAICRELDLTEEQKGKIRDVFERLDVALATWEEGAMKSAGQIDAYMRQLIIGARQHDQMIPAPPEVVAAYRRMEDERQVIVDAA